MKRSKVLGTFLARARAVRVGTLARRSGADLPISYVEVDVGLVETPQNISHLLHHFGREGEGGTRVIRWRGGYTAAAVHRTIRYLMAMGATFPDDDPTSLDGLGSREFRVVVAIVECDTEETHGAAGVFRYFVRQVLPHEPRDGGAALSSLDEGAVSNGGVS